jgi:hypothetical protein
MDRSNGWRTWARERAARAEPVVYALFAACGTLYVACVFYSSLRLQTAYSLVWMQPERLREVTSGTRLGDWSAPLDDVFIHFDFARAAARGHPLQWSEGNGYSSGGTSLLYPFVLAFGYWAGFRGLSLEVWAGIVAATCVFGLLLACRRAFEPLPRFTSYLLPPALLGIGVLDWSLFSGMEVALLLGLWALCLLAWCELLRATSAGEGSIFPRAWLLGVCGVLLVATRPEAVVVVAVFALTAAGTAWRTRDAAAAVRALVGAALPAVLLVAAQSVANYIFTGEGPAAGAVVKLEVYHPYLSGAQILDAWWFHVKYQVLRVTQHHLGDAPAWGWLVWACALVAVIDRRTRLVASVLWASALLWIFVVALNGQVRWQNERYTMPALAWLLIAAALGVACMLAPRWQRGHRFAPFATGGLAIVACALFAWHQGPRFRDQLWFFGRASRNILDQHIRAGRLLRHALRPTPKRVLVGDAGAIPYSADLAALDIIGLGGFHGMPFARATRLGIGAAIELVERLPPAERPDAMAIYPSWWGAFPLWFGDRVAEVPVRGNVICGGASKVLYVPDWKPLEASGKPFALEPGERIVDELDHADLLSERAHGYRLSKPAVGFVDMKLLPHPTHPDTDVWDAGRTLGADVSESFVVRGSTTGRPLRLLLRVAPSEPAAFAVDVSGARLGVVELRPMDGWSEVSVSIPPDRVRSELELRFEPLRGERKLYHLWAVQRR